MEEIDLSTQTAYVSAMSTFSCDKTFYFGRTPFGILLKGKINIRVVCRRDVDP